MFLKQIIKGILPQKLLMSLEHQHTQKIPQNKQLMLKPLVLQPILVLFYYPSETIKIYIYKFQGSRIMQNIKFNMIRTNVFSLIIIADFANTFDHSKLYHH